VLGIGFRRPRWTLRLRLTLLYGGLFLIAGAVLLAITDGLVANSVSGAVVGKSALVINGRQLPKGLPLPPLPASAGKDARYVYATQSGQQGVAIQVRAYAGKVNSIARARIRQLSSAQGAQIRQLQAKARTQLAHQRSAQLNTLLTKSGVALAIMAIISIGLGWLMAGRALRPVRTMSARARGISERNLHARLALEGPNDELKELGDTIDGLLARLETAFESQRRFVANASHELRTPITLARTLVEVALADPHATMSSLRDTCERVLAAGEQQERLIEALLTLARSQRGLEAREDLDLGAIAADVVREALGADDVRVESELGEAWTLGDPALVERLVANLIDNALKYNQESGWVRVWTGASAGRPTLRVANTGPVIPASDVDALVEPFRRLNGDRAGHSRGLGLGLSIVAAIAEAHGAAFLVTPRAGGGLEVEVSFPPARGVAYGRSEGERVLPCA
jgi:signal transduction histidine kinase